VKLVESLKLRTSEQQDAQEFVAAAASASYVLTHFLPFNLGSLSYLCHISTPSFRSSPIMNSRACFHVK
jgi:hypothetical protein